MKIIVLLKQTFDTEEKIVIENGQIKEDGVTFVINPYDEYAVEEAVKLKEQLEADVTVITVGPDRAENALRTALAMGADRAVRIEAPEGADEYVAAELLTAVVQKQEYDLILAGNMSVDNGAGQVAIRVAEQLGIAHVSGITKLTIDGRNATVERDVEGDTETSEVKLPFLATAQQGLNEPRYPSLPGIMKAKKKPLDTITADELGLSAEQITAKTAICDQYLPPKKAAGKVLKGNLPDQVNELVTLLRHEAKII